MGRLDRALDNERLIDTHLHLFMPPAPGEEHSFIALPYQVSSEVFVRGDPTRKNLARLLQEASLPVSTHWLAALDMVTKAPEDFPEMFVAITIDVFEQKDAELHPSNEQIRRLAQISPNIIPCVSVSPNRPNAVKLLEQELKAIAKLFSTKKFSWRPVVKLSPNDQFFFMEDVPEGFWKVIQEHNGVVVSHTGPSQFEVNLAHLKMADPRALIPIAKAYRDIDFVLIQMGTPDFRIRNYYGRVPDALLKGYQRTDGEITTFEDSLRMVMEMENVWGDMSGLNLVAFDRADPYNGNTKVRRKNLAPFSRKAFDELKRKAKENLWVRKKNSFWDWFSFS